MNLTFKWLIHHVCRLNGSYFALIGGQPGDALQDMTGGLLETHDLPEMQPEERAELYETMLKYQGRASLMAATITVHLHDSH